jgi:GNAT superfamily N-acetyltransferase
VGVGFGSRIGWDQEKNPSKAPLTKKVDVGPYESFAKSLAVVPTLPQIPPMSLSLRHAATSDVPLILKFIRALADYEHLTSEVEATEARLQATLFPAEGHPAAECVLAFVDSVPAGIAIFFTNYSTFLAKPGLYLEDLFVAPEWRGRGVGKSLLLHLAGLANARGCGRMEWTVLDWNTPAIEFYESIGARRLREWQICRLTGPALEQYR